MVARFFLKFIKELRFNSIKVILSVPTPAWGFPRGFRLKRDCSVIVSF
jgi:hypothetical protein